MSNDRNSSASRISRRRFAEVSATAAVAGYAALHRPSVTRAETAVDWSPSPRPLIRPGDVVLFQGDSITEAGRKVAAGDEPNTPAGLGNGYPFLAVSQYLLDHPGEPPKFFNRGASGNKLLEMIDRWQTDCLDLKPDVLSILIGVNDFWHTYLKEYDGSLAQYERDYRQLLQRTRKALPEVRIVIGEPFISQLGPVTADWFPAFVPYREATKRVASEAGAVFIPYQSMFEAAEKIAPPDRWSRDGCHTTADGTALLAHWWLKAVGC